MEPKRKKLNKPKLFVPGAQGTEAWQLLRVGKVTASRVADVLAFKKDGSETVARRDYRLQVVTEMLTGFPTDYGVETADMRWGKEQEPNARIVYTEKVGVVVEQIAFAQHPQIEHAGASPDGLVGKEGLLELKCPRSFTHIGYFLTPETLEADYREQVQWQLAVTGRAWCDIMSYDPRMPEKLRVVIRPIKRDEVYIKTLTDAVLKFIAECLALKTKLEQIAPALTSRS
jgi:putative phage-type endonuclease